MPTYEYACRACGHRFDAVQSMTAAPLSECPECGGELRKVFHPAGIAFKGSGFYATDSRKKPSKAAKASDGGGAGSEKKDAKEKKKETAPSGGSTKSQEGGAKETAASSGAAGSTGTPKGSDTK